MSMKAEARVLWEPSEERKQAAVLTRYMQWLRERRGLEFGGYHELWQWSVEDLEGFWSSIWEFFEVRGATPYEQALADRRMPGARWFPGARLNYSEHVFRGKPVDRLALQHASELRQPDRMTWGELRDLTTRIQNGLRALGVQRGDRVVAYMPNIPETLAAFLACAGLGAVWSSCSPDFGARSVVDRFAQIEPKVLLAVDGYRYNGRDFDRLDVVANVRAEMPSLERTVILSYLNPDAEEVDMADAMRWDELLRSDGQLTFEPVPFDHPLWVLYSSGTTGLPKAIVQGHGGILLEHLKILNLHFDTKEGDSLFWFTTTGWMMWNLLAGGLLTPASIVLFDGSPAHPDLGALWELAERTHLTCFGTSASYIAGCMKAGLEPAAGRDLSALRSVGSTGSPLSPEGFDWIYEHLAPDTWLFSTSGGTDVCTAFVGGVPLLPVYRGELQARALGVKVEAFDEAGSPVVDQVGELVITEPMPSMPLFLWGDADGERYRETYFSMYPGVWRHGDWIQITSRGTAVIYGRSDSTINRGGVRMGTSEIYRAVRALSEVQDVLVVDLPRPGTEGWMPLFVVLRGAAELTPDLVSRIKRRIQEDCSPRHVPNEVYAIPEVPTTLSGKVLEVPVKKILMGTPAEQAASRDSLANPQALDYFVELGRKLRAKPGSTGPRRASWRPGAPDRGSA
jgi:acetoacetyl-CoA synthetase